MLSLIHIYLAVWAEGKHITTLEGLMGPNGELSDIQQAFMEETAIQCGFCTPGFIMTAVEDVYKRQVYLLQADGGAAAPVADLLRDDGVDGPHQVDDVRLDGPGGVAGKARGAGAEQHGKPLALRNFCRIFLGHGHAFLNELGQRLRRAGPVQDIPQHPIGGGHIIQVRLDEHLSLIHI